jgi:molybdate transport system regulatory protein
VSRHRGLVVRVMGARLPVMGPGKAELIMRIDEHGSISAAARAMGMSYRRAWMLADALNSSFREPIVSTVTGGQRGGGAVITPLGRKVLALYRGMEDAAAKVIAGDMTRLERLLRQPRSSLAARKRRTRAR